ncbi:MULTISPECIES: hypothetical protein [unclassified Streptomyces]|uniref:hypothetical protein n=1 Tax=unclassified Streptomyces TaxID=2593676 RepID=UPI002E81E616|nr:hypothetical protein [Streptomyces sp. NBC_00562]WUC24326.1 hypothetical protein OHA33_39120 [Streptomyces sp. NBC_00562]
MISSPNWTESPQVDDLPHFQDLLDSTDWASLVTAYGMGENLPAMLARLLDPDPGVRLAAANDAFRTVNDQNTIYEAAVPVALYVAAILNHPVIATGYADPPLHRPTLVTLLDGLSDTAYDADDQRVAIGERHFGEGFLDDYWEMRAFRDLRPALFSAIHPLLSHESVDIRDAALTAAVPLVEHPALSVHRGELVEHARGLLVASPDNYYRELVLDAMKAWGQDISGLENADDVAARELRARHLAEHCSVWPGNGPSGPGGDLSL